MRILLPYNLLWFVLIFFIRCIYLEVVFNENTVSIARSLQIINETLQGVLWNFLRFFYYDGSIYNILSFLIDRSVWVNLFYQLSLVLLLLFLHYIGCEDCQHNHGLDCPKLGPAIRVEDRKVQTKAVATLPDNLSIQMIGGSRRVIASEPIARRTQFGPLEAKIIHEEPVHVAVKYKVA